MKWLRLGLLAILAGAGVFLMVEAGLLAIDARKRLDGASQRLWVLSYEAHTTLLEADAAMQELSAIQVDTTRTEAEMAGLLNQTRKSMMTPAQTKELVDRAANVMDNANLSVIRLGAAAQSLEGLGPTAQGAIAQFAQDAHQTLKAATDDLSNPEIRSAEVATKAAAESTAKTMANVEGITADVKKEADAWVAPVKGFWNHAKLFLREIAGPTASVATAIK